MYFINTTLLFLFFSIIGFGQNSEFVKLDSFFRILEEHDRFLGSVAISRDGQIIYSKAIGYADIETNVPNTIETKFRIGSITKTFTATLIMKAVEMGNISLDDTIDEYFPNIQNADKITVRHLLNHRSGINTFTDRQYLSWYTKPIAPIDLLEKIVKKGIGFEPDDRYEYSNSNYVLLTFILENVFGNAYAQILEQYIVRPLKLENTSYGGIINPIQNEARSYRMNTEWTLEPEGDMSIPLGAGGIISTPTDLCFFVEALFNGKLISAEGLEQMKPVGEDSYGFALQPNSFDDLNGWGHGGVIDAFTSSISYLEESNLSFALSSNGSNYGKHEIAMAVLNEVLGKPYELPSFEFIELDAEDLDQYLGIYETDELPMDIAISREGNQLIGKATGRASFLLMAEGNHRFFGMKLGIKMHFKPSEKTMHFEQGGLKFKLTLKQSLESIEATNEDLDQYLGTFVSDQLPIDLTVRREGNTLICQGTGQPSFPLTTEGNHKFSYKEIGLKITFIPEENKMLFEQGGASFEMKLEQSIESIETNLEDLDQYLGTFVSDQLPIDLTISREENMLICQGTGQPSFPLTTEGNHKFSNKEIGLKITFIPEEKKMQFEQGGCSI